MFNNFLNSLKRPENQSLIETIQEGYKVIFESTQINKFPISALIKQAKKFKTFKEFEYFYIRDIYHGYYWHLTKNPDFKISSEIGPRDMSSLSSGGQGEPGALMMTSHFEYWNDYYNGEQITRPYAVLLDASDIDPPHLKQVSRGFGNEVYLHASDAKKLKIIGVYNIKYAKQLERKFENIVPQSEKELYNLWKTAVNDKNLMESVFEEAIGPVYHGTGKEFYEFEPHQKRNMQMGFGIHFTPDPKFAELYKKGKKGRVIKANLDINKLFDAEKIYDKSSEEGQMLYEMNPNSAQWGIDKENPAAYAHRVIDSVTPQRAEKILRKHGYDGVRYISKMCGGIHHPTTQAMIKAEAETYVVFDNSQIKQIPND